MKIKSLGLKVSLIVAAMIAAIIVIIVYIVSVQSDHLVMVLAGREAKSTNVALAKQMEILQKDALTNAKVIAYANDVVNAIINKDEAALKTALLNHGKGIDTITVCDADGNVLMRTHTDQKGDNVLNQAIYADTLKTGEDRHTIAKGATTGLSTRGAAVIKDYDMNIIGVVVCGNDLSNPEYVDAVKKESNCETTLFDGDTRISSTLKDEKGDRVVGTKASDTVIDLVIKQKKEYGLQVTLFGSDYYAHYSPLIVDGDVIGMLFTGVLVDEVLATQRGMMNLVLMAGIACGIACVLLLFIFNIFAVSRPLKKIGGFAHKIRVGDIGISSTSTETIGVHSSDEVGVLARELEAAYMELRGYVGEIKDRMHGLAGGDLITESTYGFQGDFVLIKDSINEHVRNLNHTMNEINSAASQVSSGSKQVADGAQTLAQGSIEQAASIEELSNSISDIADKTKTNAEIAEKAARLSATIRENAEKGSRQMGEMMAAVKDINEASQSISKVIKVIDDIAFQTNILALNAAVEAARAGQHGKGFAVVAEEVRNLAAKSAEAAKETGDLIANSAEKAELGSHIAGETSESLAEIVQGINESSRFISQIAQSSDEQSREITQINTGIDQVAQVVQQNSATAEESAAASEEMSGQSDMLQQLIAQFKLDDDSAGRRSLPSAGKPARKQLLMPEKTANGGGDYGKY